MNNNYDCDSCTRWICIHRNMFRRLPIREGGAGLCPGHISAPDSAQQPELEVNAQMGKLILNKEKFLKTELGKKLIDCAVGLDSTLAGFWNYLMDSDERLKMQRQADIHSAQWEVYQAAMRQFYGLELHFSRTAKYFGVCTEDESFWLFKVERGVKNVQAEN